MLSQARPLEQRLYAYHFENGGADDVLRELVKFQNPDGGFGHALEPDQRFAGSSVLATTVALGVLREVRADERPDLAAAAVAYLLAAYDPKIQSWLFLPAKANTAPHAPWWGYEEYPPKRWVESLDNPRPVIVGYLHEHADLVDPALLEQLTAATVARLHAAPGSIAKDDVECYVHLLETPGLPEGIREQMRPKLTDIVQQSVTREPDKWSGYCLKPLDVAPAPDSPMADALSELIDLNLDYEIEHQDDDGSWAPNWTWGDNYPDVWPQAEKEWRGVLTLTRLKQLRAFGRLE